ncbi:BioY family protein [Neisseriaceae bacterium B1]
MSNHIVHLLMLSAFLLSKVGVVYIAYVAVANKVEYAGWFVFLAIAYTLSGNFSVSDKS